ncbi:hypothetical protein Malapachy_0985 [Malassezia pachydermatis]|uniref:CRAL-TRIO domain-containing protein n=1 Tax=Malassezia pachydermatis TaxID=77020 RepID=A0A0M9VPT0_9BASI|nr:hypothetical protein Malapachy_0985 [Malassezia pachydermatis]KOS14725.1 hypothetical protein Malapachy_0985 [Malassezia pachydermatis]
MTTDVKLSPPPDSRLLPPAPLREGDDEKMAALKQVVDAHRAQHPCPVDYEPYEHHWLSDPLIYSRYIRATRGDLKSAKKRIIETLTWRRDYRPEIIPPGEVSEEAYTGKHVITGFDRDTRPILYLRPGRENTKPSPRQIRYMVWSLERAIDLMQPGQESVTIIVDFHGAQFSTMPSLGTARHVAHILQTHYAERLGRAFVFNTPKFITAFFTALSPFLDPVTKDKIRFNYDRVTDFIAPDQLDAQFPGGNYAYRFDFDVYWPALIEKCGILPDGTRTKEMLEK